MPTFVVASTVVPSRNCTVPVATAGVIEAVKVTFCPKVGAVLLADRAVEVAALLTVTATAGEVLPVSLASPLYTAVMLCTPADNVETDNVALPPLTGEVPSTVVPSRNCTVPFAAAGDTAALKITGWPEFDGLADDVRFVEVEALFTVIDNEPVAGKKIPSPLYAAVRVCGPVVSVETVMLGVGFVIVTVPSRVAPSENWTVPVVLGEESEAVKVIG